MTILDSYAKTIRSVFTDGGALLFCIVVPLVYPIIYTLVYNNEVVREVPVVVVDDSHSKLSRDFVNRLDATPDVRVVSHCPDMESARQMIKHRDSYGIVMIPSDFQSGLMTGRQVNVQIYCDMSGMLYYKAILIASTEVSLDMNAQIKVSQIGGNPVANASGIIGGTPEQQQPIQHPIQYESVYLFNPQSGFATFLIPAVLILAIQQTMVLGIGLIAGTRREREIKVSREHNTGLQITGVAFAMLTVYIPLCAYEFGLMPHLFSLPQLASFWELTLFTIPFLLAVFNFGIVIGGIPRHRESITLLMLFTTIPMLFMSGVSWPGSAIPAFWKYVGYLFPSTFGINAYIKLNSLGGHFESIRFEYIGLWIQWLVYGVLAWLVTRRAHKA